MNNIIYKYYLPIQDTVTIPMPVGSNPMTAMVQNGKLHIWAEVDKDETRIAPRTFQIVGTGQEFNPDDKLYIGSVIIDPFVWHVYEFVK